MFPTLQMGKVCSDKGEEFTHEPGQAELGVEAGASSGLVLHCPGWACPSGEKGVHRGRSWTPEHLGLGMETARRRPRHREAGGAGLSPTLRVRVSDSDVEMLAQGLAAR